MKMLSSILARAHAIPDVYNFLQMNTEFFEK